MIVFLATGIIGNMFSNLISTDVPTTMIKLGASNSLYGMIGLSIGYMIINWEALEIIGPIFKLKIILNIIITAILLIIFTDQASNIDYSGHLGGFLAGLFISGLMPSLKLEPL